MHGRPRCETSHRTLRARQARQALFALFLILTGLGLAGSMFWRIGYLVRMKLIGEVASDPSLRTASRVTRSDRPRLTPVSCAIRRCGGRGRLPGNSK